MKNRLHIFILKSAILLLPAIILIGSYIYFDPFRVIFHYDNYYRNCFAVLNRDYVGTEVYLNNRAKKKYDAFIFGNSKSLAFMCADWQKYIHSASPLHYDASCESPKAICDKLNFINSKGDKIDYALIVMDPFSLNLTHSLDGPVFRPHPDVCKSSWKNFHIMYLKYYLTELYFVKYADFYFRHTFKPYMQDVIEDRKYNYLNITNDLYLKLYDEQLETNPDKYIKEHKTAYISRDTATVHYATSVLKEQQLLILSDIKKIFDKNHTNFKIVLGPAYTQEYFNTEDLNKLDSIFGKKNVYDFTGKNEYSRYIDNFYESVHYRPKIARDILKRIYAD